MIQNAKEARELAAEVRKQQELHKHLVYVLKCIEKAASTGKNVLRFYVLPGRTFEVEIEIELICRGFKVIRGTHPFLRHVPSIVIHW